MKLRDYQTEALNSIWSYFQKHQGNPLVAMPTGTGKSLVIAGFVKSVYDAYPGQRIMMLTHVKELIEQNFDKLKKVWPEAPAGIYSAGIGRRDTGAPITFAGIMSVVKKPELFGHIDLLIIDECHLVSPKASTSYQTFIKALKEVNPYLKVVGLSATIYRLGLGLLTEGNLFTDVCIDLTKMNVFNRFIGEGYLSPLIPKRTEMELSLENVGMSGGEYINKQLQEEVDKTEITNAALHEIMAYGADRKHWLIFSTGTNHSLHIAEMLETFGVPAKVLYSGMAKAEREEALAGARTGKYRALVNNNILTTGFDFPGIDLIGVLRPTASPGLWVQMLGRGTRPVYVDGFDLSTMQGRLASIAAGPKQNCLVLDFAGNTGRLGPINDPVIPVKKGKGKGKGSAPVRVCEKCNTYVHASKRICPECGYEFPIAVKFGMTAGVEELIKKQEPVIGEFGVNHVIYSKHIPRDPNRMPSLKVTYQCGLRRFVDYHHFEHYKTYPRHLAHEWWRKHTDLPCPETVDDALTLAKQLTEPSRVRVWVNKKYPEILEYII